MRFKLSTQIYAKLYKSRAQYVAPEMDIVDKATTHQPLWLVYPHLMSRAVDRASFP